VKNEDKQGEESWRGSESTVEEQNDGGTADEVGRRCGRGYTAPTYMKHGFTEDDTETR
jgi:hypothetical protein